jgi:hypothetical protein
MKTTKNVEIQDIEVPENFVASVRDNKILVQHQHAVDYFNSTDDPMLYAPDIPDNHDSEFERNIKEAVKDPQAIIHFIGRSFVTEDGSYLTEVDISIPAESRSKYDKNWKRIAENSTDST